jgi:hypothetical protein
MLLLRLLLFSLLCRSPLSQLQLSRFRISLGKQVHFSLSFLQVLRIRDVYSESRIRISSIPDPGSKLFSIPDPGFKFYSITDPGSASKNLSFLTKKIPDPDFSPIPDPGIEKGTGSRIRNTDVFMYL